MADARSRASRTRCQSCNAPIIRVKTHKGNWMPVDAEPVDNGNLVLDWNRPVTSRMAGMFDEGEPRYVSHFATCPDSSDWRRR